MKLVAIGNELKDQQLEAIKFLEEFIESKDLLAVLTGYAGTGKTYLLKHFLNNVYKGSNCVSAPTHKAVRILETQLGKKGKTIQSLCGLRPDFDVLNFDIHKPQFNLLGVQYIQGFSLVVIDECSMIGSGLFTYLDMLSKQFKTKILYVGDECQLPPINEAISPTFKIPRKFELTDIIRQSKGNPLLELLDISRKDVQNNTSNLMGYIINNNSNVNDEDKGYELLKIAPFADKVGELFLSDEFKNNTDHIRHLSFTNKSVTEWNTYFRNVVLFNPKDSLTAHDLITSYKTLVDSYLSPIIVNSEDYLIDNIRNYTDSYEIDTFAINFKNVIGGLPTKTLKIVNLDNPEAIIKYIDNLSKLHWSAIKSSPSNRASAWRKYYEFKDNHLSMQTFSLPDINDNATVSKDIDYGYSLTIHKCQGSTYDNISIDLDDIYYTKDRLGRPMPVRDIKYRNQLIYVALSRAKNKAVIRI